jgi:capsular polysaccharide biosynthesis protein
MPPTDQVHVVIEVREFNRKKANALQSGGRVISNMDELVAEIKAIPGVKLTVKSFARIPFKEQVALAHSAGVLLTMHGAGTANMFHSAIGAPNCCSLIELFPDTTLPFSTIRGFGNLARHMGMHYFRYQAKEGSSSIAGTKVDISAVVKLVKDAVQAVKEKPSCLNNASSSTVGLLSSPAFPFSVNLHDKK